MKRITLLTVCFLLTWSFGHAQKMDFWLDAGLKVQHGFTALYNANATTVNAATTPNQQWDNTVATGTKYGFKLGMNWNYTGVSLDVLKGKMKGEFQRVDLVAGGDSGSDEITLDVTDIYLLFRNAKHKGYIELGPKLSIINDVSDNSGTRDLGALYEEKALSAVLGFGTYLIGPPSGRFSGILGLRFEYGFQDIVNDAGRSNTGETSRVPVNYGGEASTTHPIFAGLVFEFNWGIGGVGQARCGERSKFIWF